MIPISTKAKVILVIPRGCIANNTTRKASYAKEHGSCTWSSDSILRELHSHQVLYKDVEARDWLWDNGFLYSESSQLYILNNLVTLYKHLSRWSDVVAECEDSRWD